MRRFFSISMCAVGFFGLAACENQEKSDVDRAFADVNVVDETNLNEVMLSAADPNEARDLFPARIRRPTRAD